MDSSFWHQKWQNNDIGFHQSEVNPLLVKFFSELSLIQGARILLPLCGKTLDIAWLQAHGYRVVGVELSEMAVQQLFEELGVEAQVATVGPFKHYRTPGIDIFVGDFFAMTPEILGPVNAVYDRAALVALPAEMRARYASQLIAVTRCAPQLLISYSYDQEQMAGPPFSVTNQEIKALYGEDYHLEHLVSVELSEGLKGKCAATENAWLLDRT